MFVLFRSDKEIINSSGQNAADIARFWNHKEALDVLEPTEEAPEPSHFKHVKHVNFFGHGTLDRASEKRKDKAWLEQMRTNPQTKYILLSDLQAVVVPIPDFSTEKSAKKSRLLVVKYPDIAEYLGTDPLVILLGTERQEKDSVAWFAVDASGIEDISKLHAHAETLDVFPGMMMLAEKEAGMIAQARAMLAWHDR